MCAAPLLAGGSACLSATDARRSAAQGYSREAKHIRSTVRIHLTARVRERLKRGFSHLLSEGRPTRFCRFQLRQAGGKVAAHAAASICAARRSCRIGASS
jgi:hypothetical protein